VKFSATLSFGHSAGVKLSFRKKSVRLCVWNVAICFMMFDIEEIIVYLKSENTRLKKRLTKEGE